ncbi:MAG: DUF2165 family protein [Cellvibrionaceae bacterium]
MHIRLIKTLMLLTVAIYCSFVVFNNLSNYDSNFRFVQHVLSMDTVFPANRGHSRAITDTSSHHFAYSIIIGAEIIIAALCWMGVINMLRTIKSSAFKTSKILGCYGLALGFTLWFGGFIGVGGEWFMMWQSKIWNGQQAAFRISVAFLLLLIFLSAPEPDQ